MQLEVALILALILVNGLLSGAEIAIVSLRPGRLAELVRAKKLSAFAVQRLRSNPERFLATVQIGITVVGAAAAAFGGATFTEELEPLFARFALIAPYANEIAFVLVVAGISYLSVIIGELVPKSLALRHAERYALLAARPLEFLAVISRPIVWLLTVSSNAVLKLFGDHTTFTEARLSVEELRGLVIQASKEGSVDPAAGAIVQRALEFGDLCARDVMVHRRYVVTLSIDAGVEEVRNAILTLGHRRLPVYEGSHDNIVGYISWRDVVERVWSALPLTLREIVRAPYFVPESAEAAPLLRSMQAARTQLALVVDEHGGFAGIVTIEDLLEELVGEIFNEHDSAGADWLKREEGGAVLVQGSAPLRELEREIGVRLVESENATTLNGLCIELSGGRVPAVGTRLPLGDEVELEVVEASSRRVRSARIRKIPARAAH